MIKSNYTTMIYEALKEKEEALQLLKDIMENHELWGYVVSKYQTNSERILLLGEILPQLNGKNQEDVLWKIMEYGSKIREEDHIARQIFLWLYSYI
ncbi:MAG: hypothetical protein ACI4ES_02900 [Roseburia sp.]